MNKQYVVMRNGQYLSGKSWHTLKWVDDLHDARVYKNTGTARTSAKYLLGGRWNKQPLDDVFLQAVTLTETPDLPMEL